MLPAAQIFHRVAQGEMFHPGLFLIFFVGNLVHHVEGVPAVGENGLVEAHGVLDGVHGIDDVLFGDANLGGNLLNAGLLQVSAGEGVAGVDGLVGGVLQGARDPDGTGIV